MAEASAARDVGVESVAVGSDPCRCSNCAELVVDVAAGVAEMQLGRVDLAIARLRRLVGRHQLVGGHE